MALILSFLLAMNLAFADECTETVLKSRPDPIIIDWFTIYAPSMGGTNGGCAKPNFSGVKGEFGGSKSGFDACKFRLEDYLLGKSNVVMAASPRKSPMNGEIPESLGDKYYGGIYRAMALEKGLAGKSISGQRGTVGLKPSQCIRIFTGDTYGGGSNGKRKTDIATVDGKPSTDIYKLFGENFDPRRNSKYNKPAISMGLLPLGRAVIPPFDKGKNSRYKYEATKIIMAGTPEAAGWVPGPSNRQLESNPDAMAPEADVPAALAEPAVSAGAVAASAPAATQPVVADAGEQCHWVKVKGYKRKRKICIPGPGQVQAYREEEQRRKAAEEYRKIGEDPYRYQRAAAEQRKQQAAQEAYEAAAPFYLGTDLTPPVVDDRKPASENPRADQPAIDIPPQNLVP